MRSLEEFGSAASYEGRMESCRGFDLRWPVWPRGHAAATNGDQFLTRRNGHVQPAIWLPPPGARSVLPQSYLFCCDRAYTCVSGRKEWFVQLQFLPMIDRPRYGSRRACRRGLMPSSPVPSILVQTQPTAIVHGQRRCIAST